jgi:hypothetical protein
LATVNFILSDEEFNALIKIYAAEDDGVKIIFILKPNRILNMLNLSMILNHLQNFQIK